MSNRRIAGELRKLRAMARQDQPLRIALSIAVAEQALMWAADEGQGYVSPSQSIALAKSLTAPAKRKPRSRR